MATNATWSVVFDDKRVIKKSGDMASNPTAYVINDDSFWNQSKFSNIWAIQYETAITSDQVEYRDETPHSSYADANLGDFQDFITRWDSAHLAQLQAEWDANDPDEGWASDQAKIDALGARPTSYSS
jgi:hypothetical protein|tara:strand:+ start:483 stop:863 length:381 start_codon:yes stop_codon:yes gene_type:complete